MPVYPGNAQSPCLIPVKLTLDLALPQLLLLRKVSGQYRCHGYNEQDHNNGDTALTGAIVYFQG